MTYSEQLKDPRWQKKRLSIFNRDNFTCQKCRSQSKNLQVHHKKYTKNTLPWDYDDDVLVTLCNECHKEAADFRNQINDFLAGLTPAEFEHFAYLLTAATAVWSPSEIVVELNIRLSDLSHDFRKEMEDAFSSAHQYPDNAF